MLSSRYVHLGLWTLLLTSCSSSNTSGGSDGGDNGAGGEGNGVSIPTGTNGDGGQTVTLDNACAAESQGAEGLPLDMYVMYDQSASMECPLPSGGTRWAAVTSAFEGFVQSKDASGISVGLQYFGLNRQGQATGRRGGLGGGADQASCNVADYAKPEIEIATLSSSSAQIVSSLKAHGPSSCTPTNPALQGAIQHAADWKKAHEGHVVIVVLVTDGEPNCCQSSVDGVAAIAAAGLAADPAVKTFVIGITSPGVSCQLDPNPPSKMHLDTMAKGGGTDQALLVDVTKDTSAQILDSLNKIRGLSTLPCTYQIPKAQNGGVIDFHKVNVSLMPGHSKTKSVLKQASSAASCDGSSGGWYYDNASAPTSIKLCDATCKQVTNDTAASVDVLLGCQTEQVVPQ